MLTNPCFLTSGGAYRPAHCWFQKLSRAGVIAADDIALGTFLAAAMKSLSEQETERKE